ncbi:MAG: hypothetical protein L6R48_04590 [Planctomycetes bacterium]|nr:hypothetical protein [Planctomycetota bacterium]
MIRLAIALLAAAGALAAETGFEVDGHPAWGALDPVMGEGLTPADGDVAWIAGQPLAAPAPRPGLAAGLAAGHPPRHPSGVLSYQDFGRRR